MKNNRQWLLARRPEGMVSREDFSYAETPAPEPAEGEILIQNQWLSFDPAQRNWMEDRESYLPPVALGAPMRAATLGRVVESRHSEFKVGEIVQAAGGWQDYVVVAPGEGAIGLSKVPQGVPPEMMMSVLGLTSLAAYFGLLEMGQPQLGETVVVSGAAGATGSVAGQIARIKGCRVVGIAGGPEKCEWLEQEAGFDVAIDYKRGDVDAQIAAACPDKWDVFFDNVGGNILEAALNHLNLRGRVVLCGAISGYNATEPMPGPSNLRNLIPMRARMQGFIVLDYLSQTAEALEDLLTWVNSGELKYRVDIKEGFENIPDTLGRLFTGQNQGKQLLKI